MKAPPFLIVISLLFIYFHAISFGSEQDSKFHWASKYYKAVELAAEGDFLAAKQHFDLYTNPFKSKLADNFAKVFKNVLTDLFKHKINEEAAQYIFKGLNEKYNHEKQSLIFFYLNRASALLPIYDAPFILRGMIHLEEREYDQAMFEFIKAVEVNPKNYLSHYFLGRTYSLKENYNAAIEALNKAIKINEKCAPCFIERFNNYHNLSMLELALNDFIKAIKIDSSVAKRKWLNLKATEKLNDMGNRFKALKDYQKSIRSYSESILYDSRWVEPYLNRGIVYSLINKPMLALKDFNRVIELDPDNVSGYFHRALIYMDVDEPKKAETNLIQVLNLDEMNAQAYFELAKNYNAQKDLDRAILYFHKSLELNQENIWALYWLGYCYDTKKLYREALHWYGEFLYSASEEFNKHKVSIQKRVNILQKYKSQ